MAVKRHLVKVWTLAKSKVLAIVLIFIISAAVTVDAFELMGRWDPSTVSQTGNVFRYWWFKALAAVLLVNLAVCTADRFIRQLRLKGRVLSRWGSVLFHTGLAVIIVGTLVTGSYRTYCTIKLIEGDTKQIPYRALIAEEQSTRGLETDTSIRAGEPDISFTLDKQEMTFNNSGGIKEILSYLTISDKTGPDRGYDLADLEQFSYRGLYMFPNAYGYAVIISAKSSEGETETITIPLQTVEFSDGIRSYSGKNLQIASLPNLLSVNFYTDIAVDGNAAKSINRSNRLENPGLFITAINNNEIMAQEIVPLGGTVQLGGYTLTFEQVKPWTELLAVYDPGANPVFAGIIMAITGLSIVMLSRPFPAVKGRSSVRLEKE